MSKSATIKETSNRTLSSIAEVYMHRLYIQQLRNEAFIIMNLTATYMYTTQQHCLRKTHDLLGHLSGSSCAHAQ